jgi:hypothetical protein
LIVIPPYYKKMELMTELLKAMQERMERQIGSPASKMDANHAEIKAMQKKKMDGRRATPRKTEPREVRSQSQPSEKKKWLYTYRSFGTKSLQEGAM